MEQAFSLFYKATEATVAFVAALISGAILYFDSSLVTPEAPQTEDVPSVEVTEVQNKNASTTETIQEPQPVPEEPKRTHIEVDKDTNVEFNVYKETNSYSFDTDNWQSFSLLSRASEYGFTFNFPKEWKYSGSSYFLLGEEKIAEFNPPGITILKEEQSCFESIPKTAYKEAYETLIKEEEISHNGKTLMWAQVENRRQKVINRYCLQEGGIALTIAFYTNPENQTVLRDIMSSVSFYK